MTPAFGDEFGTEAGFETGAGTGAARAVDGCRSVGDRDDGPDRDGGPDRSGGSGGAGGSAPDRRAAIAIVGAGPRGTSLLERIGAELRGGRSGAGSAAAADTSAPALDVHVIDDAPDGAGRIWRTDQPRDLCMNTLAHAVTLFTEPGSTVEGPVVPGPTLYEWCVLALDTALPSTATRTVLAGIPEAHVAAFRAFGARDGLVSDYRDELEGLLPESHPSRALYGEYLAWCYRRAVALLPAGVRVIRHRTRAAGIRRIGEPGGSAGEARESIALADGGVVEADAVILATGWMPRTATGSERALERALAERPDLVWVRPASPVEQDLAGIAPGAHAIVRGLGMGFFDTVALLTIGRGGEFVEDPGTASGLRYLPSGQEPVLHATSNRGVPFRAKSLYRSLPPSPAQRFLRGVDWASRPRPIDFDRELWPRLVADAFMDHAETLHRLRPEAAAEPAAVRSALVSALDELLAGTADPVGPGGPDETAEGSRPRSLDDAVRVVGDAVAPLIPDPADRFDLLGEMRPADRSFASPAEFDAWVVARTATDLREAELGRDSAVKAGLWSISAARGVASRIGTLGGFDAESRRSGLATLFSLGGMVGSGPPAFRNRQLLALVEAGLVRFIGPRAGVRIADAGFVAESPNVVGSSVTAPALIDAWMHFHDLAETADPIARSLVRANRAGAFRVAMREGGSSPTGAFEIDFASGRLVGSGGELDPAVHVVGIPVDEQLHDTIISPMPGTDPPMLRETDRVARSAIRIAASAAGIDTAALASAGSATVDSGALGALPADVIAPADAATPSELEGAPHA